MNKNIEKLLDSIDVCCEITCSKCREIEYEYNDDGYDFAEKIDKEGWRATEMNVYCPTCAKKLKRKKK